MERLKTSPKEIKPKRVTTDAYLAEEQIDGYVATGRIRHADKPLPVPQGRISKETSLKQFMSRELRTFKGLTIYAKSKEISDPIFGQIKHVPEFRQFLLRGLRKVSEEWNLICLGHNLLKFFKSTWRPSTGAKL